MNFQGAIQNLKESWQRSVLCGIGVAVASIAIVLLVSIGLGVQKDVSGQIDDFGTGVLIVLPGKMNLNMGSFNPNFAGKSYLTEQYAQDVSQVKVVQRTALFSFVGGYITYQEKDTYPLLLAASPEWFDIHKVDLSEGNVYTKQDENENICVIGSVAAEELFAQESALGKTVTINEQDYKIVGVTQETKAENSMFSTQSLANVVYIPVQALKKHDPNIQIDRIFAQVDPNINPDQIIKDVETALSKTLNERQFSVLTQEDLLQLIHQVMGILGTLVIGLTSIALFVGGVGIMTVMLLSVGERKKEIGVRLATGAKRKDIFQQFLIESSVIGFFGVTAGLVVSVIVCSILAATTNIKPLVTPQTVGMTFAVGLGVGIIFGLIPAVKASRLDPVAALRLE